MRYVSAWLLVAAEILLSNLSIAQKPELVIPVGHTNSVFTAEYSPDGKYILTSSADKTAKVWEARSGKLLHTLTGHLDRVKSASYSPDGKCIVTVSSEQEGAVKVWDARSGKLLSTLFAQKDHWALAGFSANSINIVTSYYDNTVKVWEPRSGKLINTLKGHSEFATVVGFSPNGKSILTASNDGTAKVWDSQSGKLLHILQHTGWIYSAHYSPDGTFIITASVNKTAKLWSGDSGKLLFTLNHAGAVIDARSSPDGKLVVTTSEDNSGKIWDAQSGKLLHTLELTKNLNRVNFSPDSKRIVIASQDNKATIWEVQSGKLLHALEHTDGVTNAAYSPDGKSILTASFDNTAKVWDAKTFDLLRTFGGGTERIIEVQFGLDGSVINTTFKTETSKHLEFHEATGTYQLVAASIDFYSKTWDANSGRLLNFKRNSNDTIDKLNSIKPVMNASEDITAKYWPSPDGKYIATVSHDGAIQIKAIEGDSVSVIRLKVDILDVDINFKTKRVVANDHSFVYLLDLETGNEILRLVAVDKEDWVVTHPSGLFDASPGAMDKLYFVSNLDIIELKQLKTRYYEPGLWKKVMSGEKLRNVVGFNSVELPPEILIGQVDSKGNLPIEVVNKGGGIGEVTLYLNGKETIRDLRPAGTDPSIARLQFSVPISSHKNLIPEATNVLGVKAWNAGQWIESRGEVIEYTPSAKKQVAPSVHLLICGVSDYTGTEIDLKYSAKDAEDITRALTLAATRLFGPQRTYVYSLTSGKPSDTQPTKINIERTFEKISSTASAADVLVVYLAGHGINIGGAEGDFHYLTAEAFTSDLGAYADPAIRKQATISSAELVELFKKVPAQKQVLMIDACASGKVVDNLMARRDIESGTLKALDRMKDRTGMHIITGCAADAVSYEASRYGQGIMTYSLLEGMRGAALRDSKFVDVARLFHYAQDRVPILATGIGGIQAPQIFSPYGSQSFDVGELTSEEKAQIPLAKARPIYIRSNFIEEQKLRDVIGLGKRTDEMLNESATRGGEQSPLLFVDVSEYPEGCQLSGLYKQVGGKITLRLNKSCEGKEATHVLEGVDEKDLIKKIIELVSH